MVVVYGGREVKGDANERSMKPLLRALIVSLTNPLFCELLDGLFKLKEGSAKVVRLVACKIICDGTHVTNMLSNPQELMHREGSVD